MRSLIKNTLAVILPLTLLAVIMMEGCNQKQTADEYKNEIDSIGIIWVPDLRDGIFDVELVSNGINLILKGETDITEAKEAITNLLRKKDVTFIDSLTILPDTTIIKKPWGLVNVSVCNIRFYLSHDAEMVTQALMGTPLRILKLSGGWMLVQTPDRYIGWIDNDAVEVKSDEEFAKWRSSSRLFYVSKTGDIFTDRTESKVISDIVAGCILEISNSVLGYFEVLLPDGRKGFIPKEKCILFENIKVGDYLNPEHLVKTAETFMGIPYIWGGTSSKGFDCSGFVKTVYYLNGLILSRDASQQFENGIRLRRNSYPDSLRIGDLLFFGRNGRGRPRATHVGMYIGDSEFIHCSGMVRINSLDSTRANFSRSRRDSFIGVRRIIGAPAGDGIKPVLDHDWYN